MGSFFGGVIYPFNGSSVHEKIKKYSIFSHFLKMGRVGQLK